MSEPKAKYRAGAVSCAIWSNEATVNGRAVEILKATIERRYRDKMGVWKSSGSFSKTEIPQAVFCLIKAYVMMMGHGAEDQNGSN